MTIFCSPKDTFDFDDVLDEATTDADGHFYVEGKTAEVTPIDPMLKIYHDCDDQYMPCQRRWKLFLPKSFILNSTDETARSAEKIFDAGEMNLESYWHKESRTCWH
uniref:Transthyretin-like family protein n=1 Tax=Romanomermis culicivorax TaxID=13658 RepID=A0A915HK97_ROMCU